MFNPLVPTGLKTTDYLVTAQQNNAEWPEK